MFQVSNEVRRGINMLVYVGLGAGWVAYGMLGGGRGFLTAMVVASVVLMGGARALLRSPEQAR